MVTVVNRLAAWHAWSSLVWWLDIGVLLLKLVVIIVPIVVLIVAGVVVDIVVVVVVHGIE